MSNEPPTPPGWYPHGENLRYWDWQAWTEHIAPKPPERAQGIVIAGYVFAALFPLIGLILGVIVRLQKDRATNRHGPWIILLAFAVGAIGTIGVLQNSS